VTVDVQVLALGALVAIGMLVFVVWVIDMRGRQVARLRRAYNDLVVQVENVLTAQQQLLAELLTSEELHELEFPCNRRSDRPYIGRSAIC